MTMNQGLRQATARTIASVSTGNVNENLHAMATAEAIGGGTLNERMIARLQANLSSSETNINALRAEFAAHKSVERFDQVQDLT